MAWSQLLFIRDLAQGISGSPEASTENISETCCGLVCLMISFQVSRLHQERERGTAESGVVSAPVSWATSPAPAILLRYQPKEQAVTLKGQRTLTSPHCQWGSFCPWTLTTSKLPLPQHGQCLLQNHHDQKHKLFQVSQSPSAKTLF